MREIIIELIQKNPKVALESFSYSEVAYEGVLKAVVTDIGHTFHGMTTRVKGWFEGIESKRNHINEILENTIEWLKDEDRANPKLNLDMGGFKTWMKTSEVINYRYYYLLNDSIYNEIVNDLKKNNISELEDFFQHFTNDKHVVTDFISADFKDRRTATRMLDSIKTIKDLIVIVEKYRSRCNLIFDLLKKQERRIKGFPFQLMLAGAADLRQTVKKIVNLAT